MIRLKELREERGWNMQEAAKFLKKKYTTYVNHEKGKREPNSEDLISYAKAYGISIDYLVGRTDNKKPATLGDGMNKGDIDPDSIFAMLEEAISGLTEQEAEFFYPQVLAVISARRNRDSHE